MNKSTQKKRILFVLLGAYPLFIDDSSKPSHGGAEIDLYNVAKGINQNSFDIHFIVGDFKQQNTISIDGITLHKGQPIGNSTILKGICNFLKLFILIARINPSIIFSKGVSWQTIQLILIKKILHKKLILKSSHKRNIESSSLESNLFGKLFKKLVQNINVFILQNTEDEKVFKKTFPQYTKTLTVIKNAQNINPYTDRFPSKTLLWIGRSEAFKQPEKFLEIVALCPDYRCRMIMPNTNQKIFESIKNSATHIKNVEILAGVPRNEIEKYYQEAMFLVSTSKDEGFPNVVLESMKNGTPIISFLDYDGMIQKNYCGFISKNKLEISQFINESTREQWKAMSKNAYKFSKENFDIKKIIRKYERLFL